MMESIIKQVSELYKLTIQQHQKMDALIAAISRQENSEEIFELASSILSQYKGGDTE